MTSFPNYPTGRLYDGYRQKLLQREQKDGVRICRVPLFPSHDRSSIKRILNYFSFALSAAILGPFVCGPAAIMWVYHPPLTVGLPAWWIGLLRQIPFVYEIQDMWPETLTATSMMSHPFALKGLSLLAKFVYGSATAISVISPGFKQNLIEKKVAPEKIHIIPNWGDDYYKPPPRSEIVGAEYDLQGRFNILFAGNMGAAQALNSVIEAAALLGDLPHVRFVFIGDGIEMPSLKERAVQLNLNNVRFIERQPPEKMPEFFAWADGLLIHLRDDPLFRMTIPSKTLSYLASGKPILCGVLGDGATVIEQARAGIVFQPEDPDALVGAVRSLHSRSAGEREALGNAGRSYFEQHFTYQSLIEQYDTLFRDLISAG